MSNKTLISKLERIDWDFPGDRCSSAFSSTHFHPCRFVSQIPTALIGLLSQRGDCVVDPFCGSGTTLVEAQRLGRRALGIDINPASILISKSKTINLPASKISTALSRYGSALIRDSELRLRPEEITEIVPSTVQGRKWYHEETLQRLAQIWRFLDDRRGPLLPILKASFSSILLSVCNETRHWGYVCDNTKPVGQRYVDPFEVYLRISKAFREAYELRDLYFLERGVRQAIPNATVVHGDAKSCLNELDDESVDLIVTSPPYWGVCDYVKSQRLSMEWFGWPIEEYRLQETGARSKRRRNSAAIEFGTELELVVAASFKALKRGGFAAFVFGESKSRESTVPIFRAALEAHFRIVFEVSRLVPVQRRQHPSVENEWIFVVEKIG